MEKKKYGSKLWGEFKKFITRGSVLDLAVGMIIGSAFTAIVNGLVNYIFKPLINAIPIKDGLNGLITMLRPAYDAAGAIDMTASVYIDWGSFIMAIVNFLLTAVVLFFLVKGINAFHDGFGKTKKEMTVLSNKEIRGLLKQGKSLKEIEEIKAQKIADEKAAKEAADKAAAEAAAAPVPPRAQRNIVGRNTCRVKSAA